MARKCDFCSKELVGNFLTSARQTWRKGDYCEYDGTLWHIECLVIYLQYRPRGVER